MFLLDEILGENATATLIDAATVEEGDVPNVIQHARGDGSVEIALVWKAIEQNFIVFPDKSVSWRAGLCDALTQQFLEKLRIGLVTKFVGYGVKMSSIYAPGDTAQPFLELGYTRSPDNWDVLISDVPADAERIENESTN